MRGSGFLRLLQRCGTHPWFLLALLVGINIVLLFRFDALSGWSDLARSHARHVKIGIDNVQSSLKNSILHQIPETGGLDEQESFDGELDLSDEELRELVASMHERIESNENGHLFSELRGPGEKELREAAIRGKIFQETLDIWERLNYYSTDEALYPHADIASRLETLEDDSEVETLDRFGHLLHRLGSQLFPWFFPNSGDFPSLHASFRGQGIVLTGGNPQVQHLRTLIRSIRKLGCKLPIELLYMGAEDMSEANRADFARFEDVTLNDLSLVLNNAA